MGCQEPGLHREPASVQFQTLFDTSVLMLPLKARQEEGGLPCQGGTWVRGPGFLRQVTPGDPGCSRSQGPYGGASLHGGRLWQLIIVVGQREIRGWVLSCGDYAGVLGAAGGPPGPGGPGRPKGGCRGTHRLAPAWQVQGSPGPGLWQMSGEAPWWDLYVDRKRRCPLPRANVPLLRPSSHGLKEVEECGLPWQDWPGWQVGLTSSTRRQLGPGQLVQMRLGEAA